MIADDVPGTYYSQAFIILEDGGRRLCGCYHPTKLQAQEAHGLVGSDLLEYPVEIENWIAYVPSDNERKELNG